MLWRLSAPVRSFACSFSARRAYTSTPPPTVEPLRILFCGSDDFSITSLRALAHAKQHVPNLIQSIDVVHRPAKPTGRGLKKLREVPIKHVATEQLNLNTHVIDTFTGWAPPVPINLVIAVSFGLFVPPRILNLAKFGGLNVHPSLLPDLRGPAPIQHTLLKGRTHTGVSVQTLHAQHFDHGTILAQTPAPGIAVDPRATTASLTEQLAHEGAEMLVSVLKSGQFVPPLKDAGWYSKSGGPIDHAEKITKQHRFVDFEKSTTQEILAIQSALKDPWCMLPNGDRLIMNEVTSNNVPDVEHEKRGICIRKGSDVPLVKAACGGLLAIYKSTCAGTKTGKGNARLLRLFAPKD